MHRIVPVALVLLALAAPARAALDIYNAVLIKQFMVCDGAMAQGCERFGTADFKAARAFFLARRQSRPCRGAKQSRHDV